MEDSKPSVSTSKVASLQNLQRIGDIKSLDHIDILNNCLKHHLRKFCKDLEKVENRDDLLTPFMLLQIAIKENRNNKKEKSLKIIKFIIISFILFVLLA